MLLVKNGKQQQPMKQKAIPAIQVMSPVTGSGFVVTSLKQPGQLTSTGSVRGAVEKIAGVA